VRPSIRLLCLSILATACARDEGATARAVEFAAGTRVELTTPPELDFEDEGLPRSQLERGEWAAHALRLTPASSEAIFPAEAGWHLRGWEFVFSRAGEFTLELFDARVAAAPFLRESRSVPPGTLRLVLGLRTRDGAALALFELQDDVLVVLHHEPLASELRPSSFAPYGPGWRQGLRGELRSEHLQERQPVVLACYSWNGRSSENLATLALGGYEVETLASSSADARPEVRAGRPLAEWPEPVWLALGSFRAR
jgi:hypothetical protein